MTLHGNVEILHFPVSRDGKKKKKKESASLESVLPFPETLDSVISLPLEVLADTGMRHGWL